MKRITEQEAKNYVPFNEDILNSQREYYTITPDPLNPEWDLVTYYTSRKENLYQNREGDGDSYVYVLSNPSIPNLLKIGSTSKDPFVRAQQVSRGTGVPTSFNIEFAFKCFNAERLEREIHIFLKSKRISNDREFFQVELEEVKSVIENLGKKYL